VHSGLEKCPTLKKVNAADLEVTVKLFRVLHTWEDRETPETTSKNLLPARVMAEIGGNLFFGRQTSMSGLRHSSRRVEYEAST
jgi:hypothetical protein